MREVKIHIWSRYITMLDALEFMSDLFSFPSLSWILVFHNLLSVPSIYYIPSANDIPDKARGIEIYNSFEYERMRLHWNGCGLLLHELCHLIHQFALVQGLENPTVQHWYHVARQSGLYEHCLRRDWAGQDEDYDMGTSIEKQNRLGRDSICVCIYV